MIPIQEWLPDSPDLGAGSTEAKNVIPAARSYRPLPSMTESGGAASTTTVQGAASFRSTDLSVKTYAGDATKLYKLGTGTWSDASGTTYATAATDMWRLTQFGDVAIAVNGTDAPQSITMSIGTNFGALSGSPPTGARDVCVVRDVVVMLKDRGVYWSDTDDEANWTTGIADHQDMPDGGLGLRVLGGQNLTVFQESAIRYAQFVAGGQTFTFDKISDNVGLLCKNSLVAYMGLSFFAGTDGLYMLASNQLTPIGAEKVNRYFRDNVDTNNLHRVTGAIDSQNALYIIGFPNRSNSNGTPNEALIYNWQLQRWSRAVFDHEFLFSSMVQSAWNTDNLDTLLTNTDATAALTDSPQFTGSGRLLLAAFSTAHKQAFFDGENMEAVVTTGEAQLTPGRRSFVTAAWPLVDGGTPSIALGTRNLPTETVTWGSDVAMNSIGLCPLRSDARYHRARITVPEGDTWTHIVGLNPEFRPTGYR